MWCFPEKNCEAKKKEKFTYTVISKLFDSIFDVRGEGIHTENQPELQINFYLQFRTSQK